MPMIMSKINTDSVAVKLHAGLRVVHKEKGLCTHWDGYINSRSSFAFLIKEKIMNTHAGK